MAAVVSEAARLNARVFLVGGPVRDLLLDRPVKDIDLAVEGDAVALADAIAVRAEAEVAKRSEFATAAVRLDGVAVDLATARSETYRRPGALPSVRPAMIEADLLRRDFTVNAMAIELSAGFPGELLDPTAGLADLRTGRIRVIHDRSFQDDATRILRAVRYEQRLGFQIEPHTLDLLRRDTGYLATISGVRIRRELQRTFDEEKPEAALWRMGELGVLGAIHPALRFAPEQSKALRWLGDAGAPPLADWPVLCWYASPADIPSLVARLSLTRTQAEAVEATPQLQLLEEPLTAAARPSRVVALLARMPLASLFGLAAITLSVTTRAAVLDYIRRLRHVRPLLRGDEIAALGVARGPRLGELLARLRAAKLDGDVATRSDEERLVRDIINTETGSLVR
jgi:tRNA nucleotidyltransferase (CCA-adding enzyme)